MTPSEKSVNAIEGSCLFNSGSKLLYSFLEI